ncbi:MAG: class II aldolase/adducin family protein [Desulfobaccales bacterium]
MGTDQSAGLRLLFVEICQRAFRLGMQVASGGNLSVRLGADRYLVKPSGKSLLELGPEDLLVSDGAGRVLEGQGQPTREVASHLAVYQARPAAGAVVHYHTPYATAFAVQGRPLPLPTVHARRILIEVPLVQPPGEGSPELAQALSQTFARPEVRAVLLAAHGVLAAGDDLRQAQNLAELVEESARIVLLASLLDHLSTGKDSVC